MKNLKLAIQKKGRLTEDTIEFLRKTGLEFETYKQKLFTTCRNFPLEILYVRDDDIPGYVSSGTVDLGIIGQNILNEKRPKVKKLLNLKYQYCSMIIAVPKDSGIKNIQQLKNQKIATSYPESTKKFLQKNNIPAEIITISGSVEITPALGISQAIADLTATGSTLALNDLKTITKIYDSEAVLIANPNSLSSLTQKLITRFNAVLSAKDYKYIMLNAPEEITPKLTKLLPGLKSPTISPLLQKGFVSIQTVIKENIFWETIEKLKQLGATDIIILPIEKMIL